VKRRAVLPAAALVAVVLSACSPGEPAVETPAATVNGVDISTELVLTMAQGAPPDPGATSIPTASTTPVLNELINIELTRQLLDERDLEVSEDTEAEALEIAYQVLDPTGAGDPAAGQIAFEELPESMQRQLLDEFGTILTLARSLPDADTGATEITDEMVEAAYEESRETEFISRCSSVLIVNANAGDQAAQEARGEEIASDLEGGTSFDEVLVDEYPEPQTPAGGPLACGSRAELEQQLSQSGLPAEFIAAVFDPELGPGNAFGPITTANGVLVGVIDDETVTSLDDAAAELRDRLGIQNDNLRIQVAMQVIDEASLAADVWVDARFGTWSYVADRQSGQVVSDPAAATGKAVVPPAGPADPPVTEDTSAGAIDPSGLLGSP
jgi:hypothetical protein